MTCLIIIFVATIATFSMADIAHTEYKDATASCIKSTGVETDLIERGRKNDFVEDEKLMLYLTCVLQKLSLQNVDGSFKSEAMIEEIPENDIKEERAKAVKKCFKTEAGAPAKAAYDGVKCFVSTIST